MQFYHQTIVEKIRRDRRTGASIRSLYKKFKIPETTVSRWVRDIPSTASASQKAQEKILFYKNTLTDIARTFKITSSNAKLFASLLYWCEGSKYPSENCVAFANSDWNLIKTFLALLRKGWPIKEEKLRAKLQVHTTHDYPQILKFWSELLKISPLQFHKPTITQPTFRMKRKDYRGTCTVKYYSVELQLQIIGLFEAFGLTTTT